MSSKAVAGNQSGVTAKMYLMRSNLEIISDIIKEESVGPMPGPHTRRINVMRVAFDPEVVKVALAGKPGYYDTMRTTARMIYPQLSEGTIEKGIFECAIHATDTRIKEQEISLDEKRAAFDKLGNATEAEIAMMKDGVANPLVRRMVGAGLGLSETGHPEFELDYWHDEASTHIAGWHPNLSPELIEMTLMATRASVMFEGVERGEA